MLFTLWFLSSHVSVPFHPCDVFLSPGYGFGGATLPGADGVRKPSGPWKVSDLDIVVDPVPPPLPETPLGSGASTGSDSMSCECTLLHKQKEAPSEPSPRTAYQDLQHALEPYLHPRLGWFQNQSRSNSIPVWSLYFNFDIDNMLKFECFHSNHDNEVVFLLLQTFGCHIQGALIHGKPRSSLEESVLMMLPPFWEGSMSQVQKNPKDFGFILIS